MALGLKGNQRKNQGIERRAVILGICLLFLLAHAAKLSAAYMEHYGILECFDCHYFDEEPYPQNSSANLDWVLTTITTPNSGDRQVVYKNRQGTNSLADGDEIWDGPCEVCHTQTTYHTNSGDSAFHYDGSRCTVCHDHFPGSGQDFFSPRLPGAQSHDTHLKAKKGPKILGCAVCHDDTDFTLFSDGQFLQYTTVCDGCHSPGGAYDGVNDPAVGAKSNWFEGIYEAGGNELKQDNEDWCETCHDAGVSLVRGIGAPNVMGDNATFGFAVSGHGRPGIDSTCTACHDPSQKHADRMSRTYQADLDNYLKGYRLAGDMHIPRYNSFGPDDFQICFACHSFDRVMDQLSNFRDDPTQTSLHDYHLGDLFKSIYSWDSDWDGQVDSVVSCPACHNVHGSPSPAMARHGELISTPGTRDKVPALDFRWYLEDNVMGTNAVSQSRYGGLLCSIVGGDVSYNKVCYGCHETGRIKYYRLPTGVPELVVDRVATKDAFGSRQKTFAPGDPIKYLVKFRLSGLSSFFVKAEGWAYNKTGKDWATKFSKKDTFSPGSYKWRWNRTVPAEAKPGSKAVVRITIRMYDQRKGTLLGEEEKVKNFRIADTL